jgi:Pyruvate/2-oxoacid:ferredoxin oxidoreductase gamma subunit
MVGKMIRETGCISFEEMEAALAKVVSAKRANLAEINLGALKMGYEYEG